LKEFYEAHHVPQGASLTLEKKSLNQFNFWMKTSKKKISVLKVSYDSKKDVISQNGEEEFTFAVPNKIIHLQRETLVKLLSQLKERKKKELPELLVFVFKNFGLVGKKFTLHYLRAYHLVDILKRTTQEDVEKVLLSTPEFSQSEKKPGIFFYKEKIEEEEEKPEVPEEIPPAAPAEERIEEAPAVSPGLEAPVEEIPPARSEPERKEEIRAETFPPIEKAKIEEKELEGPPTDKREKVSRKKRMRLEAERAPRAKRGTKRALEERISAEEYEQEALRALKEKEKKEAVVEKAEAPPKVKEKKAKPVAPEEPKFGLFAEKLKTALDKKGKEKDKEKKKKK
jgi:hypothetical protein